MSGVTTSSVLELIAVLMIGGGVFGLGSATFRSLAAGFKRRARLAGELAAAPAVSGENAFAQLTERIRRLGGHAEAADPNQASALRAKLARAGRQGGASMTLTARKRDLLLRLAKHAQACIGSDRRLATALARDGLAQLESYRPGLPTFQITPAGRRLIALGR